MAEIGGAWLIWQGVREHRGVASVGAGIVALAANGFVATAQPDANFGRLLAAYDGIFVGVARWRGAQSSMGSSPISSIWPGRRSTSWRGGDHVGAAMKNLLTFKWTRRFTLIE